MPSGTEQRYRLKCACEQRSQILCSQTVLAVFFLLFTGFIFCKADNGLRILQNQIFSLSFVTLNTNVKRYIICHNSRLPNELGI